ncbi:hypothetical protein BGW80DRAFT_1399033, partial [Lactifluus volemus]
MLRRTSSLSLSICERSLLLVSPIGSKVNSRLDARPRGFLRPRVEDKRLDISGTRGKGGEVTTGR